MSDYLEVRSMEEVAYLLNILFTNMNNLDRVYYDMFINPEPMDITLERYDDTGTLTTVVLPNRAKDRVPAYSGSGNPNGNQVATVGALYIDISSKSLYYKGTGSDAYGWILAWSSANLVEGTDFLSPSGDGSQLTNLNAGSITGGTLAVARGGTGANSITGLVKGNGAEPFTAAADGIDYLGPASFTGLIAFFPVASVPAGWLYCDGAAYSRTTYKNLFDVIGTTYGTGDNVTTFNIPDLRGYFIRGWDSVRTFNMEEAGNVGNHSHTLSGETGAGTPHSHTRGTMEITGDIYNSTVNNVGSASGAFTREAYLSGTYESAGGVGNHFNFAASRSWTGSTSVESTHTHSLEGVIAESTGSGENTVRNMALVPVIKY